MSYLLLIIPIAVIVVIGFLCYRFWTESVQKAMPLQKTLLEASERIKKIREEGLAPSKQIPEIKDIFKDDEKLSFLWSEFSETLHEQQEEDEDGIMRTIRIRATVPSEYFFSSSAVIESRIKTEFFKHLPGVLTACGIVGTFLGLLVGLTLFDPTDLAKIQDNVGMLLGAVRDAFIASFVAIFMSVVITWKERRILFDCNEALSGLTANIDALFDAGLENDYLESISKSVEESAYQSKQLKDGLVGELRPLLQNLVDNQINELKPMLQQLVSTQIAENAKLIAKMAETTERLSAVYNQSGQDTSNRISDAYKQANSELSAQLSESITESLKKNLETPLSKISGAVQTASGDQSMAAQQTLQSVLDNFIVNMKSSFGDQLSEAVRMMTSAQNGITEMSNGIRGLIGQLEKAGTSSQEAIGAKLEKSLGQMDHFIQTIQSSIGDNQRKTSEGLANTMAQLEASL